MIYFPESWRSVSSVAELRAFVVLPPAVCWTQGPAVCTDGSGSSVLTPLQSNVKAPLLFLSGVGKSLFSWSCSREHICEELLKEHHNSLGLVFLYSTATVGSWLSLFWESLIVALKRKTLSKQSLLVARTKENTKY